MLPFNRDDLMRFFILTLAALTLAACGERGDGAASAGCARAATHEVHWTNTETPDVITTRSDGPTCAQAVVTFVARDGAGNPLWVLSSAYYDLTAGGLLPEDYEPVSDAQMDTFLAGWADVTVSSSGELPQWRDGVATLTESASTFTYDTPFEREAYEMLRGRNLAMICYAAAVEVTQCLIIDPASRAATPIVAYGP